MNFSIEAKDIVLLLVGVVGSVIANYIYKELEGRSTAAQKVERDLASDDLGVRNQASRQCMLFAAKFYIFANMFWVVSGAAWVFGDVGYGATLFILGAASVFAIFLFWLSLRWLIKVMHANAT